MIFKIASGTQQSSGDTRTLTGDFDQVVVIGYGTRSQDTSYKFRLETAPIVGNEGKPFVNVEEMPEFPGGKKELMKFIVDNMKYPPEAKAQGIQGTVIVQFVIAATGKLDNPKVVRGVNSLLDEEALRVLRLSPNWTPGKPRRQSGCSVLYVAI